MRLQPKGFELQDAVSADIATASARIQQATYVDCSEEFSC